jgi:hypothetical protein
MNLFVECRDCDTHYQSERARLFGSGLPQNRSCEGRIGFDVRAVRGACVRRLGQSRFAAFPLQTDGIRRPDQTSLSAHFLLAFLAAFLCLARWNLLTRPKELL